MREADAQALHLGPREAVDLLVEERHERGVAEEALLGLPVDRVPRRGVHLRAAAQGEAVERLVPGPAPPQTLRRVERAVHEAVRVGIVRDPAREEDVVRRLHPEGGELLQRPALGLEEEAALLEGALELGPERGELAE